MCEQLGLDSAQALARGALFEGRKGGARLLELGFELIDEWRVIRRQAQRPARIGSHETKPPRRPKIVQVAKRSRARLNGDG